MQHTLSFTFLLGISFMSLAAADDKASTFEQKALYSPAAIAYADALFDRATGIENARQCPKVLATLVQGQAALFKEHTAELTKIMQGEPDTIQHALSEWAQKAELVMPETMRDEKIRVFTEDFARCLKTHVPFQLEIGPFFQLQHLSALVNAFKAVQKKEPFARAFLEHSPRPTLVALQKYEDMMQKHDEPRMSEVILFMCDTLQPLYIEQVEQHGGCPELETVVMNDPGFKQHLSDKMTELENEVNNCRLYLSLLPASSSVLVNSFERQIAANKEQLAKAKYAMKMLGDVTMNEYELHLLKEQEKKKEEINAQCKADFPPERISEIVQALPVLSEVPRLAEGVFSKKWYEHIVQVIHDEQLSRLMGEFKECMQKGDAASQASMQNGFIEYMANAAQQVAPTDSNEAFARFFYSQASALLSLFIHAYVEGGRGSFEELERVKALFKLLEPDVIARYKNDAGIEELKQILFAPGQQESDDVVCPASAASSSTQR